VRWVSTEDERGVVEHRLDSPEGADLDAACVELWLRVLGDAVARFGELDWRTVAFQLSPKEYPDDTDCSLTAKFWDSSNRACGRTSYVVTSREYVVMDDGRGDQAHHRDLVGFYLREYGRLRRAASDEAVADLLVQARSLSPLAAKAAFIDGWWDLRLGESEPGPLPQYDSDLHAGRPATMRD
jgi:hypothetical protein